MFQTLWLMLMQPSWLIFVQPERQLQFGPNQDFLQLPCQPSWIRLYMDRLRVHNPQAFYGLDKTRHIFCNVMTYRDWCLSYLL